jgi:hypothetical protein
MAQADDNNGHLKKCQPIPSRPLVFIRGLYGLVMNR